MPLPIGDRRKRDTRHATVFYLALSYHFVLLPLNILLHLVTLYNACRAPKCQVPVKALFVFVGDICDSMMPTMLHVIGNLVKRNNNI